MYYYIALIIIALIFIWRMVAGFKKGIAKEFISLVAMAVAGICVMLILSAVGSYMNREIGKVIQMVAVLAVVCIVYRIVSILLTSVKLIANLPIIKGIDKILGIVMGFAEAGIIVMLLVHFMKNWGLSLL